jgi:subtilisin family serine protease
MRNFFRIIFLVLLIGAVNTFARPSVTSTANKDGLLIRKAGQTVDGKWFTPASIAIIAKVDAQYYRQDAIYIKLKDKSEINYDKKSIKNPSIQSSISNLAVKEISAPFEKFISSKTETDNYGISKIYQVKYDLPIDPYIVCEDLMKNPEVEYATPIFIRQTNDFTPDDPRFKANEQYFLDVLKMRAAWDISKGSKSVKIAIVDSAIDWLHEDLNGNIWTNPNEIPNNSIDDDKNGFVDDIHGWDFVGNYMNGGSLKPDNDPKSPDPNNMHGTHTSGCASAVTNNTKGIASVGYSCSIIPIKVGADNAQIGGIISGYEGILYAAKLGADVINCSWGGPGYSPAEEDVINSAVAQGSVVCVSAGNFNEKVDEGASFPASFKNAFTVGSTNAAAKASSFTGYGVNVDIYAPGENIMSTVPGNGYNRQSGTSMSSPIIAGLIGLLKSIHPDWTPKQLMHQVRGTAVNNMVTNQNDRPNYFGVANAYAALTYNNEDQSKTNPGISMESVLINGKTYINDFNSNTVKATFKNYLSGATNVEITFIPKDKWVVIENPTTTIASMPTDELKDATVNLKITSDCPWFSGNTDVIVKITSGNYTNYELITLAINLPTNNEFVTPIKSYVNLGSVQMNAIHMLDANNGWLAGNDRIQNQGLFSKISNGSFTTNFNATSPCYAVWGFSPTKAIMGTGTDDAVGTSSVLITTNGGTNWTTINTTSITGFINFLHFYDDNNGILLGDPLGTVWGCATTTDGGKTWAMIKSLPPALSAEDGLVGSGQFEGDQIWFGTTMGRVFYSSDRGVNWSVSTVMSGKPITDLCFMNTESGIVVVSDDIRATSNRFPAATTDKMINWKVNTTLNYTTIGLFPVYSFSPPKSNKIYMLFSSGEVLFSEDMWNTYKPELTKAYDTYVLGDYMDVNGKSRLWHVGYSLSYLDFFVNAATLVKKITVTDQTPIDFGNSQISKSKSKFVRLQNTGNAKTTITGSEILPGENTTAAEFEVKSTLPLSIDVGQTNNFRAGFIPATVGNKKATIRLVTDGNPANVEFEVIGIADPLSVYETAPAEILSVNPNPINSTAYVNYVSTVSENAIFVIYDNLNKVVWSQYMNLFVGRNEMKINLENVTAGVYYLVIESKVKSYVIKLIKQ